MEALAQGAAKREICFHERLIDDGHQRTLGDIVARKPVAGSKTNAHRRKIVRGNRPGLKKHLLVKIVAFHR
jgi:hypothetical protein